MKNVLILGASSGIARQFERMICRDSRIALAGNDPEIMAKVATDIEVRSDGERPLIYEFDAAYTPGHANFVEQVVADMKHIDEVYLFFGIMVDEIEAHRHPEQAVKMAGINYVGAMSILEHIAMHMESNRAGLIVGVSSVAGDRGRASNYLYGSTKAGFTAYLSGLRARMSKYGVHVVTIKPGFVDTPMTAKLIKGPLTSSAEKVAKCIVKAARKRKNTAYCPGFWWMIMMVIIHLPEFIFKKLKF